MSPATSAGSTRRGAVRRIGASRWESDRRLTAWDGRGYPFASRDAFCRWDSFVPRNRDRPSAAVQIDTDTARRAFGCARSTAREVLAQVAARTGRSGTAPSGGRPSRTVPVEDLAEHYGLSPQDVIDAAALSA